MYLTVVVPLLLSAVTGAQNVDVARECRLFLDSVDKQSPAYLTDYDITYSGTLREIGATLDTSTEVQFGVDSTVKEYATAMANGGRKFPG